jgi:hypothetical protein
LGVCNRFNVFLLEGIGVCFGEQIAAGLLDQTFLADEPLYQGAGSFAGAKTGYSQLVGKFFGSAAFGLFQFGRFNFDTNDILALLVFFRGYFQPVISLSYFKILFSVYPVGQIAFSLLSSYKAEGDYNKYQPLRE